MTETSYAQRVAGGDKPQLIQATEDGIEAWFVMRIHPQKQAEFKRLQLRKEGNLAEYGEVLESGWGEVDEDLLAELKERHGIA